MATTQNAMTAGQQNAIATQLILQNSVDRIQQIYNQTVSVAAVNGVVNVQPRNVGLIRGFIIDITATVTNGAAAAATLTNFGAANILSGITLTDLQNNTRVQTTGWHVHAINTARSMRPFGLPLSLANATPAIKYGNNYNLINAPATLAATNGTGTVTMRYYLPVAYSQTDLTGAIFAGVVNATMNLGLTFNQQCVGTDPAQSVYNTATPVNGATFGGITNATVTVYQHYFDQLPVASGPSPTPILPLQSISTAYELKNTSVSGITANSDFPVSYANFRQFKSTCAIFDNGGVLNAGTDVNYFALQSANFTNIWKLDPGEVQMLSTIANGIDWPVGFYYFSHRNRPINTSQYGNMELVLNANSAASNAQLLIGYEDFAAIGTMNNAASLPGG